MVKAPRVLSRQNRILPRLMMWPQIDEEAQKVHLLSRNTSEAVYTRLKIEKSLDVRAVVNLVVRITFFTTKPRMLPGQLPRRKLICGHNLLAPLLGD